MIHAYAIDPEVAASWSEAKQFRFIVTQFGLGTPRVLLELPKFTKWKKAAFQALNDSNDFGDLEKTRLAELFQILKEHRVRRTGSNYDGTLGWLDNAKTEYERQNFGAIITSSDSRHHHAILNPNDFGTTAALWNKPTAATPKRLAHDLIQCIAPMLRNCDTIHMVDPYFNVSKLQYRKVLRKLLHVATLGGAQAVDLTIHCTPNGHALSHFELQSQFHLPSLIPDGFKITFKRWEQKQNGEKFHNRYLLTNLGGVIFGTGLNEGDEGETEDINLMNEEQYLKRWEQFCGDRPEFELVDTPKSIHGEA